MFEGFATSSHNSGPTPYDVNTPAYSSGDLILVAYGLDRNYDAAGPVNLTDLADQALLGPNGEAISRPVQSLGVDQGAVTVGAFSYIATSAVTAGVNLKLASAIDEQFSIVVARFSNAAGIADISAIGSGTGATATAPGTTATNANGMVCSVIAVDGDALDEGSPTAGWTIRSNVDVGAAHVALITRDLLTTASEVIASTDHPITASDEWVAATFVVEGS